MLNKIEDRINSIENNLDELSKNLANLSVQVQKNTENIEMMHQLFVEQRRDRAEIMRILNMILDIVKGD
ncbi:MAG: hypothetical protein GX938_08825 [Spirochaetales bacterium]|nr:hypothetical protein [Spirochaetales bacterium]